MKYLDAAIVKQQPPVCNGTAGATIVYSTPKLEPLIANGARIAAAPVSAVVRTSGDAASASAS